MRGILERLGPRTKVWLRDAARRVGLEVRPSGLRSREDLRLVHFLALHGIDTVVDVGANVGQFGAQLLAAGFRGRVISFEPLPEAHAALAAAAAGRPGWEVAPRLALSDRDGRAVFHVAQASSCSSLAAPLDSFVGTTPQAGVRARIEVETRRFDAVAAGFGIEPARTLLKIDVQGHEAEVLAGARDALGRIGGVLVELSLMPLYAGQAPWRALHDALVAQGLELWDIWPGHRDGAVHRLAQVDGLFFRAPAPS